MDSLKALLSRFLKSKWKVRRGSSISAVGESGISVAGDGGYSVVSLRACGGVDVLRSWLGENRRVGSKAWSLIE